MKISVPGVDLGKKVWSIVGLNASGAVALRRRAKRETPIGLAARLSPCIVATEACRGAHRLGRIFAARGYRVRLLSPEYVRPYVKAQKNDDRDAEASLLRERFSPEGREEPKVRSCEHRETGEAIAEAATRPTMRFVALKSQERLDMRTLHRSRDRLVGERTALINRLRAILLERGIVVAKGKRSLERRLAALPEGEEGKSLSPRMRMLGEDIRAQWLDLDKRIAAFDAEFVAFAKRNEDARRLAAIPGIGALNATALASLPRARSASSCSSRHRPISKRSASSPR